MDNAVPIPHTLKEWIGYILAAGLGYGATYLPFLFRRKQTDAETQHITADTRKTEAETRLLDFQTNVQAGDVVLGMIRELAAATLKAEQMKTQRDFWQAKAQSESLAREILEQELDQIKQSSRLLEGE